MKDQLARSRELGAKVLSAALQRIKFNLNTVTLRPRSKKYVN